MEDYYDLILWTGSVVTFLVQLYILYLISFKRTQEMKEYAYFLKLLTGYEILFNLGFGVVLAPKQIFSVPGIEIHGLAKYFGLDFCIFCTAFTFYAGAMIVFSQLHCLMYRCFIFRTNKTFYRSLVSVRGKIEVQLMFQFLSIGLSVFFYNIFYTKEEFHELIEKWRDNIEPSMRLGYFLVVMKDSSKESMDIFFGLLATLFCSIQITSFALLYLTLKGLRKNVGSMTKETYRLYRQFTALLGAQLLTPFVFIFVPVICVILLLFAVISPSLVYIEIGYLGLMLYGLTNALLTVLFITPFRKHAAKTFVYWWLKPLLKCLKLDNLIPGQSGTTTTRVVPISNNKH